MFFSIAEAKEGRPLLSVFLHSSGFFWHLVFSFTGQ
jgi:hypothetical protein